MANLKVSIVVRTTDPNGKRGWVPATGKTDPAGPLNLRYYQRSVPKHIKAGRFFDEAEVAKLRLERKLKAASMEFEVPRRAAKRNGPSPLARLAQFLCHEPAGDDQAEWVEIQRQVDP